jgi:hypothetical protein
MRPIFVSHDEHGKLGVSHLAALAALLRYVGLQVGVEPMGQ